MWRWPGLLAICLGSSSCTERMEGTRGGGGETGGTTHAVDGGRGVAGATAGSRAEAGVPFSIAESGAPSNGRTEAGMGFKCHDDAGAPPVTAAHCPPGSPGCVCGWGKPKLLADSVESNIRSANVFPDPLGNAFVLWHEEGSGGDVTGKVSRFDASTEVWTDVEDAKISGGYVRIAPDARGNAMLLSASSSTFSIYDQKARTWSSPREIPHGDWASFTFAPNGSAIAVSGRYELAVATLYDSCSKDWTPPRFLQSTTPDYPGAAMDEEGNAVIAQTDLTAPSGAGGHPVPPFASGVSACRYDAATRTWPACTKVYTVGTANYDNPIALVGVTAGPGGRARLFVDDANGALRTSEFDPTAATWTSLAPLPGAYTALVNPLSISNPNGELILIVFAYEDAKKTRGSYVASRLDVAHDTWGPFVPIAPEAPDALPWYGSMAPSGDAIVVFGAKDDSGTVSVEFFKHYDARSDEWSPQERITNADGSRPESTSVSMGVAGSAFATWVELVPATQSRKVWVNRWTCGEHDS